MQCGHQGVPSPKCQARRVKEVDRCPGLAGSPSRSPPNLLCDLGKIMDPFWASAYFSTKWGHSTQTPEDSRDSVTVLGPPRQGDISSLMIMGMDTCAPSPTLVHMHVPMDTCVACAGLYDGNGVAWLHGSPLTRTSPKDPVTHRGL